MSGSWPRRRLLIAATAAAGLPLLAHARTLEPPLRRWDGVVLGAEASILLAHPDAATADAIVRRCLAEVARLERVFSLYQPDSALSRLNRDGALDDPPPELVELLATSAGLWRTTGGVFDPSVQPLWTLYAAGTPSPTALHEALERVGFGAVRITPERATLERAGMALTLNGIAQGYITDRIAGLLRAAGLGNVLVNLGELRALGRHPDGSAWQVGIADPADPARTALTLPLADASLATSGGYGTELTPDGAVNHLFDPLTGRSPAPDASVTVIAPNATLADGLSTAFALMPRPRVAELLRSLRGVTVHFIAQGRHETLTA